MFEKTSCERSIVSVPNLTDSWDMFDLQSGQKVSRQVISLDPKAPVPYAADRYVRGQYSPPELYNLLFIADNVPSLGYKTYRLVPKEKTDILHENTILCQWAPQNRPLVGASKPASNVFLYITHFPCFLQVLF